MSVLNEFYRDCAVLVTGATGFLGKVVLEKLVRSVPQLRTVYVLIRPQNGLDPKRRLEKILAGVLFDQLRKEAPERLSKVIPITGDLMHTDLNLSTPDMGLILEEVSVVFHCAATVKFDEALRSSVDMNLLGTQRLIALCHRMQRLAAFVHASTAYANCNRNHIVESVYPPPIQPQKLIDALDWLNDDMVSALTPHLIGCRPNTYTYTKALAEFVLAEDSGQLPIIIIRPSIIGAMWKDPLPGWVDNLNGATGLFLAVGNGILRQMYGGVEKIADIIPVDVVSNLLITSGWYIGTERPSHIPVINCCTGELNGIKWKTILKALEKNYMEYPLETVCRVPCADFSLSRSYTNFYYWVNHLFPAFLTDLVLRGTGGKGRMIRTNSKLFKAVETLEYFTSRDWKFQSKNVVELWQKIPQEDQKLFPFDVTKLDWTRYLQLYCIGARKFVLKQPLSSVPASRKRIRRIQQLSSLAQYILSLLLFALLLRRSATARALLLRLLSVGSGVLGGVFSTSLATVAAIRGSS
jgi:fatty acyl-CoA reductase